MSVFDRDGGDHRRDIRPQPWRGSRVAETVPRIGVEAMVAAWMQCVFLSAPDVTKRRIAYIGLKVPAMKVELPSQQRQDRCLPAFLQIGMQKSGTSTLSHLMAMHPAIRSPKQKELAFLEDLERPFCGTELMRNATQSNSPVWYDYLDRFAHITQNDYETTGAITGEWDARTLACTCCASLVHMQLPHVRLIVILRDPVSRALSRFVEGFFFHRQTASGHAFDYEQSANTTERWLADAYDAFDKAARDGLSKLGKCLATAGTSERGGTFGHTSLLCASKDNVYGWSLYHLFLRHWLAYFSHDALLVLYLDNLKADKLKEMRKVEAHLGLSAHSYPGTELIETYNTAGRYGWSKTHRSTRDVPEHQVHEDAKEKCEQPHRSFYHMSVVALHQMAQQGLINSVPQKWLARYLLLTTRTVA